MKISPKKPCYNFQVGYFITAFSCHRYLEGFTPLGSGEIPVPVATNPFSIEAHDEAYGLSWIIIVRYECPVHQRLSLLPQIKMYLNPLARDWVSSPNSSNKDVQRFHRRLPDYNVTPLVPLPEVAAELGLGYVFLKDESNRFGLPAFKILGASWAIYKAVVAKTNMALDCSLEELGTAAQKQNLKLVTCTEGNWGRATARMAKYLQIPCIIFVPNFMDEATQKKIAGEGATVIVVDGDYDLSIKAARSEADKGNGLLVMDTSWPGYEEIPQVRRPIPNW